MIDKRATIEKIAPSVDEAVEEGLQELGVSRDEVEIEILDEGKQGLFGLGSRQARVRLSIQAISEPESEVITPPQAESQSPVESVNEEPESQDELDTDEAQMRTISHQTVSELLEKMHIDARVTTSIETTDDRDYPTIRVDIEGEDLSILIGRKAETLNALQYISNLIVGKEMGRSVPLVIDVEGYRRRRENQLRQIAQRVADQVVQTGRSQALEPMPSNERRIVHIALRNHEKVYTESVGERDRRKVVIYLKS